MTSASTRASAIVHLGKSTKRAWGYGDDRRCRPAALPPLPEQARKAGKCSPSTTYPQAPSPTKNLMPITGRLETWQQPSRQPRSEPTSKSAGLHLKTRLRLSHVRGPPQIAVAVVHGRCDADVAESHRPSSAPISAGTR